MRPSRLTIPANYAKLAAPHAAVRGGFPLRAGGRASPRPAIARRPRSHHLAPVPGSRDCDSSPRTDGQGIVPTVSRVLISLALTAAALAAAAAVALGTHPDLARHAHGLEYIMLARRLQWPLTALCLLACVSLIVLVVTGKRSAAWLLVLAPVLFGLYHRFAGDEFRRMVILDNPPFVDAPKASFLRPESPVFGLVVEGQPYAYPCGALYLAPVIEHPEADKRVLVMYSPYAGRARATLVDTTIKPREMDIVSMPANALLIYNARIGQFINAFTGQTPGGNRPDGFLTPLDVRKTTWRDWNAQHPDTRVLATAVSPAGEKPAQPRFPNRPIDLQLPADARVTLLDTPKPAVLPTAKLPANAVLNLSAGGTNLLILTDKTSAPKVFDRAINGDLFPRFTRKTVPKKPEIALTDADTGSLWTADGLCVDGYAKGDRLRQVTLEPDLPYGTLKSYYPDLEIIRP